MTLLQHLLDGEAEEAGERARGAFKQRVFASAFGSFNPPEALKAYEQMFEEEKEPVNLMDPDSFTEFVPESAEDVEAMLDAVRRLGLVS